MMDKCEEFKGMVYQVNDLLCDAKKWKHIAHTTDNEMVRSLAAEMEHKLHEMYNKGHDAVMKRYAE